MQIFQQRKDRCHQQVNDNNSKTTISEKIMKTFLLLISAHMNIQ